MGKIYAHGICDKKYQYIEKYYPKKTQYVKIHEQKYSNIWKIVF